MMLLHIHTIDLPWPHSWDQMQWLLAAWLARHGGRAHVEVHWNETRLIEQVDAATFQAVTTDFYRALHQRLNGACEWRFEAQAAPAGHRLMLGVCEPHRI